MIYRFLAKNLTLIKLRKPSTTSMFNSLASKIPGGGDPKAAMGGFGNSLMDAGKNAAIEEA